MISSNKELPKVIEVVQEKCTNCHACIQVCPVKFCNDASDEHVSINHQLCIGCGACLEACTHDARNILDDCDKAIAAMQQNKPMIAIAAPAVAAVLPEDYLRLNGWLRTMGIDAVFDVSFGAELTVKTYLEYIKESGAEHVIAQPCPAIVSYLEIWQPELLGYLSPGDSPMMHIMKMVREFYPEFQNHEIMILSPCVAKKREFHSVGIGDYNVTFTRLQEYLNKEGINLSNYPEVDYKNPPAERAVEFCNPGGLLQTAEREVPGISSKSRKIEGPQNIYPYLKHFQRSVDQGYAPLIVDCLNCEKGCSGGTGTGLQHESPDILEGRVLERSPRMTKPDLNSRQHRTMHKTLDDFWKKDLYIRQYTDRSVLSSAIKHPNQEELKALYQSMLKYRQEDIKNCSSCGYNSCEAMAIAIHNGLNRKENCHFFASSRYYMEHYKRMNTLDELHGEMRNASSEVHAIEEVMTALEQQISETQNLLAGMNQIISSLNDVNTLTQSKSEDIQLMQELTQKGNQRLGHTAGMINKAADNINAMIPTVSTINEISQNTNVLAINAAIQAARYGSVGESFAVIAREIRELADLSHQNADSITGSLEESAQLIIEAQKSGEVTQTAFTDMEKQLSQITRSFKEILGQMDEMTTVSSSMIQSMSTFEEISHKMKSDSRSIVDTTNKLDFIFENLESITNTGEDAHEDNNQEHLRLGEMLLRDGIISLNELKTGLEAQRDGQERFLGEILVQQGIITQPLLSKYLERQSRLDQGKSASLGVCRT